MVLSRAKAQPAPSMKQLVPAEEPSRRDIQSARVKRILLVDDDHRIRQIVRKALEDELGWICEEADDGVDGVSKARALRPDLVILDLSMPIMNGYDAAKVLNREMPSVPVVMMTIYADVFVNTSIPTRKIGVKAILSKTEGISALVDCVTKILGN